MQVLVVFKKGILWQTRTKGRVLRVACPRKLHQCHLTVSELLLLFVVSAVTHCRTKCPPIQMLDSPDQKGHNRTCEVGDCPKRPIFGPSLGTRPRFCAAHKPDGYCTVASESSAYSTSWPNAEFAMHQNYETKERATDSGFWT